LLVNSFFGNKKKKAAGGRTKKGFLILLLWGKIGGKLKKYPENERKMSQNLSFSLILMSIMNEK